MIGKYDLSLDIYSNDVHELREILDTFKEKFSNEYIAYDITNIIEEQKINWSPFN
jgi:hypothetical protein